MSDYGCEYKASADDEACGRTPTEPLAVGMSARDPGIPGSGGLFVYAHYCNEHLPVIKRKTLSVLPESGSPSLGGQAPT
jgi:hypothetical protein